MLKGERSHHKNWIYQSKYLGEKRPASGGAEGGAANLLPAYKVHQAKKEIREIRDFSRISRIFWIAYFILRCQKTSNPDLSFSASSSRSNDNARYSTMQGHR